MPAHCVYRPRRARAPSMDRIAREAMCPASRTCIEKLLRTAEDTPANSVPAKRALQPSSDLRAFGDCYERVEAADGTHLYIARLHRLMDLTAEHCDWWLPALRGWGPHVECVLMMDECTAGNVLRAAQSQKITFFYLALKPCLQRSQDRSSLWPVACATRAQTSNFAAVSQLLQVLLRKWAQTGAWQPFEVRGARLQLALTSFVADFDGQRLAFLAKGSAGLKPCLFCSNVLMKSSPVPARDSTFVSLDEADVRNFQAIQADELFAVMDAYLRESAGWSKARQQEAEKNLGFVISSKSILANAVDRRSFSPQDVLINDSLHCYYSNGVASAEICLLASRLESLGVTTQMLAASIAETDWRRPSSRRKHGEGSSWVKGLFRKEYFTGDLYRGSAGETASVVPLLYFYARKAAADSLPLELQSFQCLMDCLLALRAAEGNLTGQTCEQLSECQRLHHLAFCRCYGVSALRPKHHHRLHIPAHYLRHGPFHAWPMESAHRYYKSRLAESLSAVITRLGGFHKAALSRMLRDQTSDLASSRPPGTICLLPPIIPARVTQAACGFSAALSETLHLQGASISKGDVLVSPVGREAVKILFFVESTLLCAAVEAFALHRAEAHCCTYRPAPASCIMMPCVELSAYRLSRHWCCSGPDLICL